LPTTQKPMERRGGGGKKKKKRNVEETPQSGGGGIDKAQSRVEKGLGGVDWGLEGNTP